MQKNKIGLGIITCDRPDFFKKCLASVRNNYNLDIVVVDDGLDAVVDETFEFASIKTSGKIGVGAAKNKALDYLNKNGCEHLFLMEDDIEIKNHIVFDLYINASKSTGIKHFNFGLHGNHNLSPTGSPIVRKVVNYPDNTKVLLYPNILGAFSYYHKDTLDSVGYMDEQFYNALEHVDHTYQIIKAGYHPPFRWFADVEGVDACLKDIVPDHQQSKIRSQEDFMKSFMENHEKFMNKNKFSVLAGIGTPENEYTESDVVKSLKEIWKNHHQKSE
jgi:GT2 family glycosyltransferase